VGIIKRVVNLKILCGGILLPIIAVLPLPLLAAPAGAPSTPAAAKSAAPSAQTAPSSTIKPTAQQTPVKSLAKPAEKSTSPAPAAPDAKSASTSASVASMPQSSLLQLRLAPQKQIFSQREGLVMQFIFTAKSKTKLCLDKDILSQMQVSLYQAGVGKLPLKPLVIKDNSHLFLEPMRVVWLDSGQTMTVRANLKRFQLDGGSIWSPGEYSVDATFNLCEQTPVEPVTDPGHETPVKAAGPAWFMIME